MIFLKPPSRQFLRVIQLDCLDRRTYISERVEALLDILSNKYRISLEKKTHYCGHYARQCTIFEHEDGMFKGIDWNDSNRPEKTRIKPILANPMCQFILKCQYSPNYRTPKVRPFFYFEKTNPKEFSNSLSELRLIKKSCKELYWRGNTHLGRHDLLSDVSDLLNKDWSQIVDRETFYKELASHEIAISLPGLGKSCHREFECFAIGTVVVAPLFQNTYHMPLIPDYHYLALEPSSFEESLRNKLAATSNETLLSIRRNAIKYYDDYIRFESSIQMIKHLLEL
jgi:hypothetical protein